MIASSVIEDSNLCLGCGDISIPGNRRVITNSQVVLSTWGAILVENFNARESVEEITSKYKYLCRKCFGRYKSIIADYETLKKGLLTVLTKLSLIHDEPTVVPNSQQQDIPVGRQQEKRVHDSDSISSSKKFRLKAPIIVHDDPARSKTCTTVSSKTS